MPQLFTNISLYTVHPLDTTFEQLGPRYDVQLFFRFRVVTDYLYAHIWDLENATIDGRGQSKGIISGVLSRLSAVGSHGKNSW